MAISRPKFCARGQCAAATRIAPAGDRLLLVANGRISLAGLLLPMPDVVRETRDELASVWPTLRSIPVYWCASAHGSVGYCADNAIVLGAEDINHLAAQVWRDHVAPLDAVAEIVTRVYEPEVLIVRREDVLRAVVRFVLAHETGHVALRHRKLHGVAQVANENAADAFVGRVAEHLGWDARIDTVVAHSLGCTAGSTCEHGDPEARVTAYEVGREVQWSAASARC